MSKILPIATTTRGGARTAARTIRPVSIEEANDFGFLERQPDDELIRIGVQMLRQRAAIAEVLEKLYSVLDGRFDQVAVTESIIKEYGIADRKVTNTWTVNEQNLEEFRELLGKEFSHWVDESQAVSVVADRAEELRGRLGAEYEEFFRITPVVKLNRTAQKLVKTRDSPAAKPKIQPAYRKFVSVDTRAKVSIRPVER